MRFYAVVLMCLGMLVGGCATEVIRPVDPALEALTQAADQNPDDIELQAEAGDAYSVLYERTDKIENLERSIKYYKRVYELQPESSLILVAYYRQLFLRSLAIDKPEYVQEMVDVWNKGKDQLTKLDIAPPSFRDAAIAYREDKDRGEGFEKSRRQARQAIKDNPQHIGSRQLLAGIFQVEERHKLAISTYEAAERIGSESPDFYAGLALAYVASQERDGCPVPPAVAKKAAAAMKKAIKLEPQKAAYHRSLAFLYKYMGQYQLYLHEAKAADRLQNDGRYKLLLADAYFFNGRVEEQDKAYKRFIRYQPRTYQGYVSLGSAYALNGEWDKSREAFDRFLKRNRDLDLNIWLKESLLIEAKDGSEAMRQRLEGFEGYEGLDDWEQKLLDFRRGRLDETEVLTHARDRCDRAQVYFYAAYPAYVSQDYQRAGEYFQKVLDQEAGFFQEHAMSKILLKRIKSEQ